MRLNAGFYAPKKHFYGCDRSSWVYARWHCDDITDTVVRSLEKSVDDGNEESSSLDLFSLEMFENIAFIMAKHAHPDQVPDNPDEWLENFNTFSIYQILPQLIELWGLNVQTEVEARKNLAKVSG